MTHICIVGIVTLNKLNIWQPIGLCAYVLETSNDYNFNHVRFI